MKLPKIPSPHAIKHEHYKKIMGAGLLSIAAYNVALFHVVETIEVLIGWLILYDPTGSSGGQS